MLFLQYWSVADTVLHDGRGFIKKRHSKKKGHDFFFRLTPIENYMCVIKRKACRHIRFSTHVLACLLVAQPLFKMNEKINCNSCTKTVKKKFTSFELKKAGHFSTRKTLFQNKMGHYTFTQIPPKSDAVVFKKFNFLAALYIY